MIIGIAGKIGSGKDTVAQILQRIEPHKNWQNKKLSSKLKQIAYLLTGYSDQESIQGRSHYLSEWGMTVREFQQRLGVDAIRNGLHESAWILALFSEYHPLDNWILTDIRFPNEVIELKRRGFPVYRVIRENDPFPKSDHISETALDDYPLPLILNNGSIEQLEEHIKIDLLESLKVS